jgi:hypothetical protein
MPSYKMPGWRSTGILLSKRSGDETPHPCTIIPPGLLWPARIADQSAVRAGAGERAAKDGRAREEFRCADLFCARNEVGRGVGQGYFA